MELIRFPNRPKTDIFELDVPFNDQVDNKDGYQGPGYRQCNATSAAMIAKFLKPALFGQYRDFANGLVDALDAIQGDTTDHGAITDALANLGIRSYFTYNGSIALITRCLYLGVPVLTGTKYKTDGHMIVIKGRGPGYFTAHNPYGERDGTSDNWIAIGNGAGKNERLSAAWMQACVADLGENAVWMRIVTHVDGVATGLT